MYFCHGVLPMSQHEPAAATHADKHEDADSRVDARAALIVLVVLAVSFLLFASNFDGAF